MTTHGQVQITSITFVLQQIQNVLHPRGATFWVSGDEDVAVCRLVGQRRLEVFRRKTQRHQKTVLVTVLGSEGIQCKLLAISSPCHR